MLTKTSFKETFYGVRQTTSYSYDILKRLTNFVGPGSAETAFFYDEQHQPIRVQSGKTNVYNHYNELGFLTRQSIVGTSKLNINMTYDPTGNMDYFTDGTKVQRFSYDFAGRLETWTNSSKVTTYQYNK